MQRGKTVLLAAMQTERFTVVIPGLPAGPDKGCFQLLEGLFAKSCAEEYAAGLQNPEYLMRCPVPLLKPLQGKI